MTTTTIIQAYTDKIGGLVQTMAIESYHLKGKIELVGTGMKGDIEEWMTQGKQGFKIRNKIDLGVFKQENGYDGTIIWRGDSNGMITNITSEEAILDFELKGILQSLEFATFKHPDIELHKSENDSHFLLHILYHPLEREVIYFINRYTFLLDQLVEKGDQTTQIDFADYRAVGNILYPFFNKTTHIEENQTQIVQYEEAYLNEKLPPSFFEMPSTSVQDYTFANGSSSENNAFEFWGHIYLKVALNGIEKWWVLDSGAGKTLIDKTFSEELNLKVEGTIQGKGVSETTTFELVQFNTLAVDGLSLQDQLIIAAPIAGLFKGVIGVEIGGILGYDFMSRFVTKVDFAKQLISFYDAKTFEYHGEGQEIAAEIENNLLHIPLTIDQKYTGKWSVDTGAASLSFMYPAAQKYQLHEREGMLTIAGGVSGEYHSKRCRFESVQIGDFQIDNPLMHFPNHEVHGAFANPKFDGNLGTDLMRHFTVYFDYIQRRLILEKNENFNQAFPENQTGIQFRGDEEGHLFIKYIAANGTAAQTGIQQGDQLVAINDTKVEETPHFYDLQNLFKQVPGTPMVVTVQRGEEELQFEFVLDKVI